MNVWLVNQYALIPSQSGGTRHYDMAKELVRRGHKVVVWASSRHYGTGREAREHQEGQPVIENLGGITWVWLKTLEYQGNGVKRGLNMLSFFWSFLKAALTLAPRLGRPDILVGSSVHPFAPLATLLLGRLWNKPAVTEIRDLWPGSLLEAGVPRYHPAVILFGLIEKVLYRFSDGIISVLPRAHDVYRQGGMTSERIFVVPNGTDLEIVESTVGSAPGSFRAGYLGAFGHHNHLTTLIEAAEILQASSSPTEIVLIGSGPEQSKLEQLIQDKALGNIRIQAPVPKNRVPTALQQFDVLIFHLMVNPIFRYGISPNKLFDYLGSGRPVVFACQSANDPVGEAEAGLSVPPQDPESLARALEALRSLEPSERSTLGANGQKYVRAHHTIEALARQFEHALISCLEGRQQATDNTR